MRVLVLTNTNNFAANYLLTKLANEKDVEIVGIMDTKGFTFKKFRRQAGKMVMVAGVFWSLKLVALMGILKGTGLLKRLFSNNRQIFDADEIAKEKNIPFIRVKNINSPESLKIIKKLKPDLIISNYFLQMIKEKLLKIPTLGTINVHPGILPNYRGLYSYFWKLVNREKRGGVSIHYVTTELDEGELIARKTYRIRKKDTVIDLSYKSAKIGTKLLLKTLKKIKAKELTLQNHKKISTRAKHKCYGYPTRAAAKKLYQNGRNLISIKKLTKYL